MRPRFPRQARLLESQDFTACFAARQRLSGRFLLLNWAINVKPECGPRLGLAISRKADKRAVVRNRIKRVVRTQFRLQRALLPAVDLVITARREAAAATRQALADDLQNLLKRLPALPRPGPQGTMPRASEHAISSGSVTDSG